MSTTIRPELPPPPPKCERLPLDKRGYPVPWFVEWLDGDGNAAPIGEGTPEFRVMSAERFERAMRERRCWVCGDLLLSRWAAFVIGPMCVVNRTSAEPPSHFMCADWSARACPFLTRPKMRRREAGLPDALAEPAGIMLARNPGVTVVWQSGDYRARRDPGGGILFDIGTPSPEHLRFYAHGRPATRDEVWESISTGLPALQEIAERFGEMDALRDAVEVARALIPAA